MKLDELLAREGIRKTIAEYTAAGDSRDGTAFSALFTNDAILEFAGFGPVPGFHTEGIENIRARTSSWSTLPGEDPSLALTTFIRHNLTTCHIALAEPGQATARTYFVVFTDIGPDHAGTYSDHLVEQNNGWLFARRRITLEWRSDKSVFPPLPQ